MNEDIDITPADVRTDLNEIDADLLPEATIEQAIADETLTVFSELPDNWEDHLEDRLADVPQEPIDAVEMLIRRRAAREAFHSSPLEVRRQALDAAVSMDAQAFRGRLNRDVEKAYEILGLARGGTSAPFVDRTSHATDPSREMRRNQSEPDGWG